jgi:release factor glutamine methyltransferase
VSATSNEEVWTVLKVLRWTQNRFAELGIGTARLDAELLIGAALKLDRVRVYTNFDRPLQPDELAAIRGLVKRRIAREPVAYILGQKEFYGRTFQVDRRVLVPRPETELLVEAALERLPKETAGLRVLDVGVGSGAIAVTLAMERPLCLVVGSDRSADALQVAAANARALGAGFPERLSLVRADLLQGLQGPFDLLVSNPPYLRPDELPGASPELKHEPPGALVSGADGLDALRVLIAGASGRLRPGGHLLLEIGSPQGEAVMALASAAGLAGVKVVRDYAGLPRVLVASRP